jgi:hypothetical protein
MTEAASLIVLNNFHPSFDGGLSSAFVLGFLNLVASTVFTIEEEKVTLWGAGAVSTLIFIICLPYERI